MSLLFRPPLVVSRPIEPSKWTLIEPDALPKIGWIRILEIGAENVYVEDSKGRGLVFKCLEYDPST